VIRGHSFAALMNGAIAMIGVPIAAKSRNESRVIEAAGGGYAQAPARARRAAAGQARAAQRVGQMCT